MTETSQEPAVTTETPGTETNPAADPKTPAPATTDAKPETKPTSLLTEPEPAGAPEKYTDFKVPEGFTLDETVATEVSTLFREANLSQDMAQKLVDFYVAKTTEASQAPYKAFEETVKSWTDQVKADPDIGGSKFPQVKQSIGRLFDSLPKTVVEPLREVLNTTGLGSNLALIKAFYEVSKQLTEPKHVNGKGPSADGQRAPGSPISAAHRMYPNNP